MEAKFEFVPPAISALPVGCPSKGLSLPSGPHSHDKSWKPADTFLAIGCISNVQQHGMLLFFNSGADKLRNEMW